MDKKEYLFKLLAIYNNIPNGIEKEIFYFLCKQYQQFLLGKRDTKYVTKEEIILEMIDKGLMKMSFDKKNNKEKLPDDRGIRMAVRRLMKNGLPILSSSTSAGYYICDRAEEIEQPYNENKKRALSILARQKGFEIMQNFINGQIEITEIDLSSEEYED